MNYLGKIKIGFGYARFRDYKDGLGLIEYILFGVPDHKNLECSISDINILVDGYKKSGKLITLL